MLNKGITMVSDLPSRTNAVLPNEELETIYSIELNFIDYHNFKETINEYLFWKETSIFSEPYPKSSALNILLNSDNKGCSRLYKLLKGSNTHIIDNIANTWENKCQIQLASFDISTSFNLHHACYNDTYLK